MQAKISVIVPVYNTQKYLGRCISSIMVQTYRNLEIILVDDGSTDDSGKLCDDFAQQDERIIVIHKKNGGVSSARNMGLERASGTYISFVDSDDELEKDMYEFLACFMEKYHAEIAHCGYKRVDENRMVIKEVSNSKKILVQDPVTAIKCMLEGKYFVGGLWNKLYKKCLLDNIFFDNNLKNHEDILFNVLAFQNANTIVFFDETKYMYYEHENSTCNSLEQYRQLNDGVLAAERMIRDCKKDDLHKTLHKQSFMQKTNLYRYLLLNSKQVDKNLQNDLYVWLKENYKAVEGLALKTKVNHFLMLYGKGLYKGIYNTYNRIRKPNWDVK